MSNATYEDDERSLLEAIRGSMGKYTLEPHMSDRIYPYTSYILKNVSAIKLDGQQAVDSLSDERVTEDTVEEFDFSSSDFKDIGFILKEIEHSSSIEMDAHSFALSLPRILRGYNCTMNFILVGTLAAFAVTHGVWLLVLKSVCANSSDPITTSMILKRVEGLFITLKRNQRKEYSEDSLTEFYIYISLLSSSVTKVPSDNWVSMNSLDNVIKIMLQVVSVAHLFFKDVLEFITKSLKDEFDSLLLLAIYWIARGVLACSTTCLQLPKHGYIIQNPQDLDNIGEKLISVLKRLQGLDSIGKEYMEDEKIATAYQIPNKEGRDNYFALMALFGLQSDKSKDVKLLHCSKDNMDTSIESLRRKVLILIISGLNISSNEIDFFNEIYVELMTQHKQTEHEFIWLPMYSNQWKTTLEEKYVKLKRMMSWYTVQHPSFITESTKQLIKDIWKFFKKTIVVVLNEDGNVVCRNAIHLMYVWRAKAFPYTRMIARALWKDVKSLDLLVLGFDPHISSLLEASKWVILYGGTDVEWIQKFITCIQRLSVDSLISVELIFVGKNAYNDEIQEIISSSTTVSLFKCYSLDSKKIWYFWNLLESLLISNYQAISHSSVYSTEHIIRQVQELLCYDSVEKWACLITPFSKGTMIHGLGELMLQTFMEYDLWKQHLHSEHFNKILYMHVEQLRLRQWQMKDNCCSRIVLNIDDKDVVENLSCPHCLFSMEKKIQYRCCHVEEEEL